MSIVLDKHKVFHKSGTWTLYGASKDKSRVRHLCRVKTPFFRDGVQTFKYDLQNNDVSPKSFKCFNCGKVAPEDMQALFRLHNMAEVEQGNYEQAW